MNSQSSDFIPLRKQSTVTTTSSNVTTYSITDDQIRSRNSIEVDGDNVPAPIRMFEDVNLPARCINFIKNEKKFSQPTPIQMQSISCLVNDRDIICLSPTGSGKTYGYLLPMLIFLLKRQNLMRESVVSPPCLIVVPTRELANQVENAAEELLQSVASHLGENPRPGVDQTGMDMQIGPYYGLAHSNVNQNAIYRLGYSNASQNGPFNNNVATHQHNVTIPQYDTQSHHSSFHNVESGYIPSGFANPTNNSLNGTYHRVTSNEPFVVSVYGGVPVRENCSKLTPNTRVVVATPGRLIDLCEKAYLSLENVKYFVIDECDKLLYMGLEEQLRKIVAMVTIHGNSIRTSLWFGYITGVS